MVPVRLRKPYSVAAWEVACVTKQNKSHLTIVPRTTHPAHVSDESHGHILREDKRQ